MGAHSRDSTEITLPKDDSSLKNSFSQGEEIAKTIPLFAENFEVSKKTEETQLTLAKKWMNSTKKIEIPVKYEEILINGKEFDSYTEKEMAAILSKIKDKITHVFSHDKGNEGNGELEGSTDGKASTGEHLHHNSSTASPGDIEVREYSEHHPIEASAAESGADANKSQDEVYGRRLVPLSIGGLDGNTTNMEKDRVTIPLWGEEIIINKRMVKLGEIVIKKYEGIEKKKINVDVRTEKITIKYPDKRKEEIL